MPEVLCVSDLELTLPNERVLSIPRLTAAENQIVTLFGPIGCGKSTLLAVIAGLALPEQIRYSGDIHLQGNPLSEYDVHESPATIVWQDQRLFDHLSVLENIGFPLRVAGWRRRDAVAEARRILDSLGFSALEGKRTTLKLSGGEGQAVAIARGIARVQTHKSYVLLLDEPFQNLSISHAIIAERRIAEALHNSAGCALIVSHLPESFMLKARSVAIARVTRKGHMIRQFDGIEELCIDPDYLELCEELGLLARIDRETTVPTNHLRVEALNSHARSIKGTVERIQLSPFGTLLKVRVSEGRVWTVRVPSHKDLNVGDPISVAWDLDAPRECSDQG